MKLTYITRPVAAGVYSIEEVFNNIQREMKYLAEVSEYPLTGRDKIFADIKKLRSSDSDIFHITGDVHYIAIGLPAKRTILTVHDINHYTHTLRGWKKIVYKWLWLDLPFRKVAMITTVSQETRQNILKYFNIPPDKIQVIHNPISRDFTFAPREFNSDKPTILQVGAKSYKNLPRLIEALRGIPCKLLVIGRMEEELIKKLKDYQIEFSNPCNLSRHEVYQCYVKSNMVSFVSIGEGFGLPIIEAHAVGRPVLTSNVSSMPEVAGDAACLVNPLDVQAIRKGILAIIKDEDYRRHLVEKGRENIKRFTPEVIARHYMDIYERIIH